MRIAAYNLSMQSYHIGSQDSLTMVTQTSDKVHTVSHIQESERLALLAKGAIKTQDGNAINLAMRSELLRFDSYTLDIWQTPAQMVDPLVINLQGGLAQVDNEQNFSFDLNNDGKKDEIALLAHSNGFLALDRNENGIIDDGSELFGAKSGDGYADLKAFDEDGNGVIDENDSVFSKLQIWQKSATEDNLISLNQARVGALLLENVDSSFTYKKDAQTKAELKKSSVVLFEDGSTGWMSHLNFSITPPESIQTHTINSSKNQNTLAPASLPSAPTAGTSSNDQIKSLVDMLKGRLKMLQSRLSKTTDELQKNNLMIQILKLSMQIAQLSGA